MASHETTTRSVTESERGEPSEVKQMTDHHEPHEITIRRMDLDRADREAVARLAELDTRADARGPVLGAEIEGSLLAAISLDDGELIADPFSRTAELGRCSSCARVSSPRARALSAACAGSARRRGRPRRRRSARSRPPPLSAAERGTTSPSRAAQCCSSGAIVRPASVELLPVELGGLLRTGPDDRAAASRGSASASRWPCSSVTPGITPGERAGDVVEGVVIVVEDDHQPVAAQPEPGPPAFGRSSVSVEIAAPASPA